MHLRCAFPFPLDVYKRQAMEKVKEKLDSKNFYYFNPEFDTAFFKNEGASKAALI